MLPVFLGMTLLRILDLDSTMVGWQGLTLDTKPYMISASLCGVKDTLNPTQDVILEGFELVQPFRLFTEELTKLVALPTVTVWSLVLMLQPRPNACSGDPCVRCWLRCRGRSGLTRLFSCFGRYVSCCVNCFFVSITFTLQMDHCI